MVQVVPGDLQHQVSDGDRIAFSVNAFALLFFRRQFREHPQVRLAQQEMQLMSASQDGLKDRLARYRQIRISVIGRKSGRSISRAVWFVLEGANKLYLLPVQGSDTQWYENVLHNAKIRISARGEEAEFRAKPITDTRIVKSVVAAFRAKYGTENVKKYYSKLDVAVRIDLSRR